MLHPDFGWCELWINATPSRRMLIPCTSVRPTIQRQGTRPVDCHISICRYDQDAAEYAKEEIRKIGKKRGSIKQWRGPRFADCLVIDVDVDSDGDDLDLAGKAVLELDAFFKSKGVEETDYTIYFSGNRGYHIYLPITLFGAPPPHPEYHRLLHEILIDVIKETGLVEERVGGVWTGELIDTAVYAPLHLIRMPHTIHPKSMRWKIPVSRETIEDGPEAVLELADEPALRKRTTKGKKIGLWAELAEQCYKRLLAGDLKYVSAKEVGSAFDVRTVHSISNIRESNLPGFGRYVREGSRFDMALKGPIVQGRSFGTWSGRNDVLAYMIGAMRKKYPSMSRDEMMVWLHYWNQSVMEPPLPSDEFVAVFNSLMPL